MKSARTNANDGRQKLTITHHHIHEDAMNRRSFIQRTAGAALGSLALPSVSNALSIAKQKVGIQLYTLRTIVGDDFPAVLEKVAEVGYRYVEFAGYYNHDPSELRTILDDLGLTAASGHFGIQELQDGAGPVIEGAVTLGMTHVVVPILPGDMLSTVDALKASCAKFNLLGTECKNAGLTFGYHNHWQEFEAFEENPEMNPWDVILDETDPELVKLELDLAWAVRGGQDPVALFEANPGRYELFHVKDLTSDGMLADVGQGTLDFPAIFEKADVAGLEYAIVEHDRPEDPLASIQNSFDYLREIGIA